MDESLKARKKLKIIVACLCATVLALAGALIGVLASNIHSLGADFSISYQIGKDVYARVGMSYLLNGEEGYPNIYNSSTGKVYEKDEKGNIIIDTLEPDSTGATMVGEETELAFSANSPEIEFLFWVKNLSAANEITIALDGTFSEHFQLKYYYDQNDNWMEVENFSSLQTHQSLALVDAYFKIVASPSEEYVNKEFNDGSINFVLTITSVVEE